MVTDANKTYCRDHFIIYKNINYDIFLQLIWCCMSIIPQFFKNAQKRIHVMLENGTDWKIAKVEKKEKVSKRQK